MHATEASAPRGVRRAVLALLVAFVAQAGIAAIRDSVTVDEVAHVAVGITMWRTGDFGLDPINPPLSRLFIALPPLAMNPVLEAKPGLDEWKLGLALMRGDTDRYHELHVAARAMTIALGTLLGFGVYRFASVLYGWTSGLLALALFAFSPTLLAHGHLATVDLAAAAGTFAVTAGACAYVTNPSRLRALALGGLFGAAIALKLSSATVFPILAVAFLWAPYKSHPRWGARVREAAVALSLAGLAGLFVVGLSYGFQGTGAPLSAIPFVEDGFFARIAARTPWLRLPVPEAFLQGLDQLATGNQSGKRMFYLAGELSTSPWKTYHFVAYGLKTPLGFLVLQITALGVALLGRRRCPSERIIGFSAALVFASNSFLNPLSLGVRHVAPAEPLLCVLAGRWIGGTVALRRGLVGGLAVWGAISTLTSAPRYLEYFNGLAGGRERGHEWLVDSNLDWGQDLIRLREYMTGEGLDTVALAYFGTVHPAAYGIRFTPIEQDVTHGIAVVSPTLLVGVTSTMWQSFDRWGRSRPGELSWLQERPPTARVGSLFVYELP